MVTTPPAKSPAVIPKSAPLARLPQDEFSLVREVGKLPATPVYKRAWFWLTLGGVALAVGGVAIYAAVAHGAADPAAVSPGGPTLTFTKVE